MLQNNVYNFNILNQIKYSIKNNFKITNILVINIDTINTSISIQPTKA